MISINFFLFVPICHSVILENLGLVFKEEEQDVTEQCHMVETRESWSMRCGFTLGVHSRWTFWWLQVLYLFSCNYTKTLSKNANLNLNSHRARRDDDGGDDDYGDDSVFLSQCF